jgi:hypothetical protein
VGLGGVVVVVVKAKSFTAFAANVFWAGEVAVVVRGEGASPVRK